MRAGKGEGLQETDGQLTSCAVQIPGGERQGTVKLIRHMHVERCCDRASGTHLRMPLECTDSSFPSNVCPAILGGETTMNFRFIKPCGGYSSSR